jgi:hypothetical protein
MSEVFGGIGNTHANAVDGEETQVMETLGARR